MIVFDLDKPYIQIDSFVSYRKSRGLILAFIYDLPIVKQGVIINSPITDEDKAFLKNTFGDAPLLCRPDAPIREWNHLLRGRDSLVDQINAFYNECRKINSHSILLCFKSPSLYFTGQKIERYEISGGVNILIEWYKQIVIDYVGPGFDVGELTRGCNYAHQTIIIPWNLINHEPEEILLNATSEVILPHSYEKTRDSRINTLVHSFGYNKGAVISAIPQKSKILTESLFNKVWNGCIKKIVNASKTPDNNSLLILVNLYGEQPHVIEVWEANT